MIYKYMIFFFFCFDVWLDFSLIFLVAQWDSVM